jgi:hypothetical protein
MKKSNSAFYLAPLKLLTTIENSRQNGTRSGEQPVLVNGSCESKKFKEIVSREEYFFKGYSNQ